MKTMFEFRLLGTFPRTQLLRSRRSWRECFCWLPSTANCRWSACWKIYSVDIRPFIPCWWTGKSLKPLPKIHSLVISFHKYWSQFLKLHQFCFRRRIGFAKVESHRVVTLGAEGTFHFNSCLFQLNQCIIFVFQAIQGHWHFKVAEKANFIYQCT